MMAIETETRMTITVTCDRCGEAVKVAMPTPEEVVEQTMGCEPESAVEQLYAQWLHSRATRLSADWRTIAGFPGGAEMMAWMSLKKGGWTKLEATNLAATENLLCANCSASFDVWWNCGRR